MRNKVWFLLTQRPDAYNLQEHRRLGCSASEGLGFQGWGFGVQGFGLQVTARVLVLGLDLGVGLEMLIV